MRKLGLVAVVLACACSGSRSTGIALGDPCDPQATPDNNFPLCASGLCISLDNVSGFCSLDCQEDSDCGDGFTCQGAGRFGRICRKLTGCKVEADCPSGHTCDADTGSCYIKVSRTLCSPCQDALQCPTGGACFEALGSHERFCTTVCGDGDACPLGFACTDLPAGPNGANLRQCAPVSMSCNAGKPLCAQCKGDSECGGPFDVCVRNVVSGEEFCGRDCNPTKNVCPDANPDCDPTVLTSAVNPECPLGFSCTNIGQSTDPTVKGPYQCVPNSNTCVNYCDAVTEAQELVQCGLGKRCVNNTCVPATDGRMCTACTTTDDCRAGAHAENRCIVNDCPDCPFKGEAFCTTPCADTPACVASFGQGFICKGVLDTDGSTINMCMPQRGTCASGLGRLGDDCTENGAEGCLNGVCLQAGTTSLCSEFCSHDADCADTRYHCCQVTDTGYDCSDSQRNGDGPMTLPGVCAPLGGLFGDDCTPGRPPCQTGTCLDLGTAQVCTVTCDDGNCPDGFACRKAAPGGETDGGVEVSVCFPNGGGVAGSDCSFGPAACESGYCIRKESGPICTDLCSDTMACTDTTWSCEAETTVDDQMINACIPPELQ